MTDEMGRIWKEMVNKSYSVMGRMHHIKINQNKWSWPNQGTIPAFVWRNRGKPWKTSFRIAGVLAEIQIEHLLNTSLEHYH
jgi:hypothetical protein